MANWQERMRLYQNQQAEKAAKQQQEAEGKRWEADKLWAAYRDQTRDIFDKLGVKEALEALRDLWEEGEVEEIERHGHHEVRLHTQLPTIELLGNSTNGKIKIGQGEVFFTVGGSTIDPEISIWDVNNRSGLVVRSLWLTDHGMPSREQSRLIPQDSMIVQNLLVRDRGLEIVWGVLSTIFPRYNLETSFYGNMTHTILGVEKLLSGEAGFNNALVENAQERINRNALPKVLRQRADDVISQLWPFIDSNGTVSASDLRGWRENIPGVNNRSKPWFSRILSGARPK